MGRLALGKAGWIFGCCEPSQPYPKPDTITQAFRERADALRASKMRIFVRRGACCLCRLCCLPVIAAGRLSPTRSSAARWHLLRQAPTGPCTG